MELRTAEVSALCNKASIEAIFFKGWSVASAYPQSQPRFYADVDVAVPRSDFQRAQSVLNSADVRGPVDLHNEFRHLDKTSWNALFSRSRLLEIDGTPVRVLSAEDEIRIISTHWLNDGGVNRERLWDIYYTVSKRPADFDWNTCLYSSGDNRSRWVACAIKLTEKYLDLDISELPDVVRKYEIPDWVVRTIEEEWTSGVFLQPLQQHFGDRKLFFQQLKKRFPPNPIQSTIEMNGELNSNRRAYYQLGGFVKRIMPSLGKSFWHLSAQPVKDE